MSATALVLGCCALVAAPVLFYALTGRAGSIVAALSILFGGAVLANVTVASSPPADVARFAARASAAAAQVGEAAAAPGGEASECARLVAALEGSNVIVDRSKPPQVTVNARLWQQIPSAQRDPVLACIAQVAPAGSGKPVIVER